MHLREEEVPMTMINRMWWDHLVPKEMASCRSELKELLKKFQKTEYGAHWMQTALTPVGLMRITPGQAIPVCHTLFSRGGSPSLRHRRSWSGTIGPLDARLSSAPAG